MNNQTYLNICGVPTRVVTWGKTLADINSSDDSHDVVLIIPGNPGFTPFYDEFLQEIYNRLKCAVWIIGHAGHEVPEQFHQVIPSITGNKALYDISGQILHKVAFIEQYVPDNVRLHLVGHSIGAYMIIELLKVPSIKSRVVGCYLLFPVFERLIETPQGQLYQKITKAPLWAATFPPRIFIKLPSFIQTLLVEIGCSIFAIPRKFRGAVKGLIHPTILEGIITLVRSEFLTVRERDNKTIRANKDVLKMYYGASDSWAPPEYFWELKTEIPDIDAEICTHNYDHSFVLRYSKEIANLVADWIRMKQT